MVANCVGKQVSKIERISWEISRFSPPEIQFSSPEIQFSSTAFQLSSTAFRFPQWLSAFLNCFPIFLNGFPLSEKSEKTYLRQQVSERLLFELRIFHHSLPELSNSRYNVYISPNSFLGMTSSLSYFLQSPKWTVSFFHISSHFTTADLVFLSMLIICPRWIQCFPWFSTLTRSPTQTHKASKLVDSFFFAPKERDIIQDDAILHKLLPSPCSHSSFPIMSLICPKFT